MISFLLSIEPILRCPGQKCKQSLAYTAVSTVRYRGGDLAKNQELEVAFEAALRHVERSLATGMKTTDGDSAKPQLEKLERELKLQRDQARNRGTVDRDWFQQTVRWVTDWVPDTEITLIAALGRIVRAVSPTLT
jgi:hypothetical protein